MRAIAGATDRITAYALALTGVAAMWAICPTAAIAQPVMCDGGPTDGVVVACADGIMRVDIAPGAIGALEIVPSHAEAIGLELFNAGVITAHGTTALTLTAQSITYHGLDTAELISEAGTGLEATSDGDVSIILDHAITARNGIVVTGSSRFQKVTVDLTGGELRAAQLGIWVVNRYIPEPDGAATDLAGPVTISIGREVEISMLDPDEQAEPAAIVVDGHTPAHVTLAGKILGPSQRSVLGDADDTLELLPGFELQGTINGGTEKSMRGDVLLVSGVQTLAVSDFAGRPPTEAGGPLVRDPYIGFETLVIGPASRVSGAGSLEQFDRLEVAGTLAPGAGSLVAGAVVFEHVSMLEIDIGADDHSQLSVGSLQIINGSRVRILNTTKRTGSFDIVLFDERVFDGPGEPPTFVIDYDDPTMIAALDYQDDRITLDISLRDEPDPGTEPDPGPDPDPDTDPPDTPPSGIFSQSARTSEQQAVARILDDLGPDAPYAAEFAAMDPAQRTAFLAQLAGSGFAATGSALLQSTATLSAASLGRIQQQSGSLGPVSPVLGYSAFTTGERWTNGLHPSVWGRLIAGTSTIGGGAGGSVAMLGGADVQLGDEWTLGLLAGIGASSFANGNTSGRSTDLSAGFYGAREFGSVSLRFGGSLTHHSVDSTRTVTAPGVIDRYTASYGALTAQLFAEAAVEFDLGAAGIELFADIGYARNFSAGFTEAGGAGALTVAGSSSDAVDTLIGVRASHQTALGTRLLTAGVMLGWKHRFMAAPSTINSLAGGTPFVVAGTAIGGSALAAGADLRLDLDEYAGLEIAYALEWGATGAANTVSARYTRRF